MIKKFPLTLNFFWVVYIVVFNVLKENLNVRVCSLLTFIPIIIMDLLYVMM